MSRTASLPAVSAPFEWTEGGGTVILEARLDEAHAVFSTRLGGVSEGPYESLNLGVLTDDEEERVRRNRVLLAQALGRERGSVAMGHQVHGAEIQVRDRVAPDEGLAKVDAQVTTSPDAHAARARRGLRAVDPRGPRRRGRSALRLARRGGRNRDPRRGAGARTGRRTGHRGRRPRDRPVLLRGRTGGARPFRRARAHARPGGRQLDLPARARSINTELERLDVTAHLAGICVSCNPELFFSHRRDGGVTGRQAGLAWLGS